MKIYADSESRRLLQQIGDVAVLGWIYVWVQLAFVVRNATLTLAEPGEQISEAGGGLAEQLRKAGTTVGDVPLIGDEVRTPFDGAGDAADRIASAGDAQVAAVDDLAFWLGLAVGAIPVLIALLAYLPRRWAFIRQATAGRQFLDASEDLDLFALRAMARQPMHRLAKVSHDPAGAWRRGDEPVIHALAKLELADSGLSLPHR
ncbi:MAG: hypothetical protein M3393_02800 [Actinomycetota bacterium]|nr:hypothetical protein [Actinomycetota bacterium]